MSRTLTITDSDVRATRFTPVNKNRLGSISLSVQNMSPIYRCGGGGGARGEEGRGQVKTGEREGEQRPFWQHILHKFEFGPCIPEHLLF